MTERMDTVRPMDMVRPMDTMTQIDTMGVIDENGGWDRDSLQTNHLMGGFHWFEPHVVRKM